ISKYSASTPSSPILAYSHNISMLRSPKYVKMGHWPNIYITNPNIYNPQGVTVLHTAKNVPETSLF
ncbi:MAG: hypothetical protein QM498_07970, partial [Desulfobacterium sp.]